MGGASTRHAAIPQVGTPYSGSRPDYRFLRPWLAKGLAISKRGMGKGGNLGNGRGNSRTEAPLSRSRLALGRVGTSTRGASTAFKEPQIPPGVEATDSEFLPGRQQYEATARPDRAVDIIYRQHSTQQPIANSQQAAGSRQHLTQPSVEVRVRQHSRPKKEREKDNATVALTSGSPLPLPLFLTPFPNHHHPSSEQPFG
ncbi:predicted protein [Histoplasma capsulatum var. duboisii H88]|uniref:Predicted protein n=1 Tax=Ajellomyces capsulatus (strain H88) TaxID=544711 RepID=F0UHW0_AJEC8|nr:predicted protein [Histoplasma capsulatum var. duboisii H88]